jgi:DNA-binding MarR family transcriptional regulator
MARMRNFGFLLKDVSRRYVLRFEQRAREISLTLPQCRALVRLDEHQGVNQATLAALADVEPMTMVRIVDRMEADGLLVRRPDPADRRARLLYLTPKAKPVLAEIWRLSALTRAETFAGVGVAARDAFVGVLEKMHASLCALDPPQTVAFDAKRTTPLKERQPARTRATRRR